MIKISTRLVILIGRWVVKIPIDRRGLLQCRNEKKLSMEWGDKLPILPIHKSIGPIIIQPRVYLLNKAPLETIQLLKRHIPEFQFDNCDLHNPENWGKTNKGPVLLDYGIDPYIATLY